MMRIGLLCRSSNLPAVIKQARTHARSAAAVANAQVHQPQGAPGTHHRPDGSTPAPISLIWLSPSTRVLPEAISHTHTRSAAAVANAQVQQPQGAPGTHVTLGGSTPAPIPLIWLSPRLRVLPAHIHTRSAAAVDNAQVPGTLVTPGGSSPVLMHALSAPASTR